MQKLILGADETRTRILQSRKRTASVSYTALPLYTVSSSIANVTITSRPQFLCFEAGFLISVQGHTCKLRFFERFAWKSTEAKKNIKNKKWKRRDSNPHLEI